MRYSDKNSLKTSHGIVYLSNAVTKEIIYIPPKPKEVPALMKDCVEWINQEFV